MTGYENAWLLARLYDVPRRERRGRVEEALARVGLEKVAGRLASTYSGGMVRRLELAQALVSRPRLLVLDEPSIGLDPLARASLWERVLGLRDELQMTVLLTTHYMEEAERLCDRVGLLLEGRLRAIGRPRELEAALGPQATLEDVFRVYAADEDKGGLRDVRSTRAVQPALWLLVFGETFTRIHAVPTPGRLPYLDYLAPGVMAQSALFIAIFYGIQLIWERDFGILTKLLATPTPRAALVAGKAFAAGVRAVSQVVVVLVLAAVLGVRFHWQPPRLLGAAAAVLLGSAFFASLSMTIAGLVRTRERLMGIGQAITRVNPLSYEVNALRQLLLGLPGNLAADFAVLLGATVAGIAAASLLLGRLAR